MHFDLFDMKLFLSVVEQSSLSRGALRCGLSLGAASSRIKNLELQMGVELLPRTTRGVSLTPAGETFLKYAREVMQQVEELNNEMSKHSSEVPLRLRVAVIPSAMTDMLPTVLTTFAMRRPDVVVDYQSAHSPKALELVIGGDVDIAVVACEVNDPTLRVTQIRTNRIVVVTPVEHPLAKLASVNFSDILEERLVGLGDSNTIHELYEMGAREAGKALKYDIHVPTYEDVCRHVSCGVGIGIVAESTALMFSHVMPIGIVPLADKWARLPVQVCTRRANRLPGFAHDFIDAIAEAANARDLTAA